MLDTEPNYISQIKPKKIETLKCKYLIIASYCVILPHLHASSRIVDYHLKKNMLTALWLNIIYIVSY